MGRAVRILRTDESDWLGAALQELHSGRLVAFPTDTVYGVAAPAFDGAAVAQIYEVKGRPGEKSIPVLIGSLEDLDRVAVALPEGVRRLAESFWPGPLTVIVRKRPEIPPEVSAGETVGVRIPAHWTTLELLTAAGPLATSSANLSGGPNALTAAEVAEALGDRVGLVLDGGRTPGGTPSTVVDCSGEAPRILREGPISRDQVQTVWRGDSSSP